MACGAQFSTGQICCRALAIFHETNSCRLRQSYCQLKKTKKTQKRNKTEFTSSHTNRNESFYIYNVIIFALIVFSERKDYTQQFVQQSVNFYRPFPVADPKIMNEGGHWPAICDYAIIGLSSVNLFLVGLISDSDVKTSRYNHSTGRIVQRH